jgi:hypothetical protein
MIVPAIRYFRQVISFALMNPKMKPNMDIYHREPQGEPFVDGSYAVYSIRKVDYQEPFWKIDQKVAKLLSELDGKGNSSRAPVDFPRNTMEGYTRFRKIQRYL